MFIAVVVILFNISETELVLHRDLDTNQELRDAGVVNVVSGAFGGIPATTPSMSALGDAMRSTRAGRGSSPRSSRSPRSCSARPSSS